MDDYVRNTLIRWNLNDLIPKFREEQVNSLAFQYLTEDMIKELVPRVGRRAIFRYKYIEFKRRGDKNFYLEHTEKSHNNTDVFVRVIDENDLRRAMKSPGSAEILHNAPKRVKYEQLDLLQILNDEQMKVEDSYEQIKVEDSLEGVETVEALEEGEGDGEEEYLYEIEGATDEAGNQLLLSSTPSTPSGLKITIKNAEPPVPNITVEKSEIEKPAQDLRNLLKESVVGRSLLEKKTLTSINRNQISDIIVQYLINKSSDYRIRTVEFLYWANAVKLVFPYELAETYYQPYKRDANTCARGKLFDKYHHVRRAFLPRHKRSMAAANAHANANNSIEKIANIQTTPPVEKQQTVTQVFNGSNDLIALKNSANLNSFKDLWPKTYDERQELLLKISIIEYFDTFSILKTYNGIHMLKQDFNRNYEMVKDALSTKWPAIAKKIVALAKPKIPEIAQQLEGDDMDIENAEDHYLHYAFILLFFLMSAKKVHKVNWVPTKLETIQSCFLYTHSFGALQNKMTERKTKLNKLGLPILPLVGAIGPSFGDLQRNFVIINNIFYEFPSLIDAVDACIKIFIALRSEYPPEGVNFWTFIQKFVYQVETPWDKQTMAIHTLWSDLEALDTTTDTAASEDNQGTIEELVEEA